MTASSRDVDGHGRSQDDSAQHAHGGGHRHVEVTAATDQRWLLASLSVIVTFMVAEVVLGWAAHSLALVADAGHMLTDAAALGLAVIAARLARRPARGRYTYGFTRIDAVSAQANGITLLLLAVWFAVAAVRRLFDPPPVQGGLVLVVAVIGVGVNLLAVYFAGRANRDSLNVRGAVAHIVNDLWAFVATAIAGAVVLLTGWNRADAVASLIVAVLMVQSGLVLVRAANRVFLEAAPDGIDPEIVGGDMARVPGVIEIHDLHVWDLGAAEPALSAHVVVGRDYDCHAVANEVRDVLAARHHIGHATLQADHRHADVRLDEDCSAESGHGPGYFGHLVDDV
ncbi:cation diffusion facilitator family transporter [Jatrophihabitans telluris]|uniref:Cation diffusion facilitator family transporter n=1 Tax=Jatrophihabitans telluris TaxID=2038343 RepID=A0ABY4R2U6_9ACTN|nr:cation diffusion facilitator family transporter [Jatrophihabitans telluris]UQX90143.1 cation diffusion facilitator family transporter [Jatrophihabitans telluris]